MTVRELREALAAFEPDEKVYLWNVSTMDGESELQEVERIVRQDDGSKIKDGLTIV